MGKTSIRLAFCAAGLLTVCTLASFAQGLPAFDAENAFVFDAFEYRGDTPGRLKLTNKSLDDQVVFSVFCFNAENSSWEKIGDAQLKRASGSSSVSTPVAQYFALVPQNGKSYRYEIKPQEFKGNTPLLVTFTTNTPMPEPPEENALVVDTFAVNGKAKDHIRFVNSSYDINLSFLVFYFDERSLSWELYGAAMLKGFGDSDFVEPPVSKSGKKIKLNAIRYFAIASRNENPYEYQMKKTSDDLYVYVLSTK